MPLTIADLTTADTDGTGTFDVLMRSVKAQLDQEFTKGRIKGTEYSTVYLGSLNLAMQSGLQFLLQSSKTDRELLLLDQQLLLAQLQADTLAAQLAIIEASQAKVPAEIALLEAQAQLVLKQVDIADEEIAIKQAQVLVAQAEADIAEAKLINIPKEGAVLDAQVLNLGAEKLLTESKVTQLTAETLNVPKQGLVLDNQAAQIAQQTVNLVSEELLTDAKTAQTTQQTANAVTEGLVLTAQQCKLQAEFDLIQSQTLKSAEEILLLAQKTATEKAQVLSTGVDADSVIGKQKLLYAAQTTGFTRDAEQKAAKLLLDTWSVRRTTDEATVADATNLLNDATVGAFVAKLKAGVGA